MNIPQKILCGYFLHLANFLWQMGKVEYKGIQEIIGEAGYCQDFTNIAKD